MPEKVKFREKSPVRTYQGKHRLYRSYKEHLRRDFNGRCGYTDCPDNWFGGSRCFHIDHFKPKKKHPELETEYSNLVYSCSYVNSKKSDSIECILDPCDVDYNEHFYRDKHGNICPDQASSTAKIMHRELALGLRRYGLIWQLEHLEKVLKLIDKSIDEIPKGTPHYTQILEISHKLNMTYRSYIQYLSTEL